MYDTADQIEDAALRHHIAMLHTIPPAGVPAHPGARWAVHKHSMRTLLRHLLTSCCADLFPGVATTAIKPVAAAIIGELPSYPRAQATAAAAFSLRIERPFVQYCSGC